MAAAIEATAKGSTSVSHCGISVPQWFGMRFTPF
jgi:hypothetical protein